MRERRASKASVYLEMRNRLLQALQQIDREIDQALKNRRSQRAADRAKLLFHARAQVVDELLDYGLDVGLHPAVERAESE